MPLQIGSVTAHDGMCKAIFDPMDALLSPPLQKMVDSATGPAKVKAQEALDTARDGWRKLSYAIASGVVSHIVANMEIKGIQTQGDISATVVGQTATQTGVTFTQSNDGTGRVS